MQQSLHDQKYQDNSFNLSLDPENSSPKAAVHTKLL
jgi:hypothetical protein